MDFTTIQLVRIGVSMLFIVYLFKQIWNVFYIFLIGPIFNKPDFKSYGEWALVTGSTDGIGKEYAKQLAAVGCNIILVSRSMDRLKAVADEIEKESNVKTKVIQIDFAKVGDNYDRLEKEIEGYEIGTLVNNVGMAAPYPEYFLDLPNKKELIENMINVNMVSLWRVTRLILPTMVKQGKGLIINVGSSSELVAFPYNTVYTATKKFLGKFSEGLQYEYGKNGIVVQTVMPGFVITKLGKVETENYIMLTPEVYVKKALSLVGTTSRTHGCFPHALFSFLWIDLAFNVNGKFMLWITKKILEKKRKEIIEKEYANAKK